MKFKPSTRQDKRLMVQFANGVVVHFGSKNGQTFIDHGDKLKRSNYLTRHGASEDWSDPYKPGTLSRFLLWGDSKDFEKNHQSYMQRFNVS
mgnify:FL=1|tara:strand:- start:121 stop:393 length:273 start_codon:yes stop_codon:yes gene_type:complete